MQPNRILVILLIIASLAVLGLVAAVIYLGVSASNCSDDQTGRFPIRQEKFGNIDGTDVYRYTFRNKNDIEIKITNYGGIITNIMVPDKNGHFRDVTLGHDGLEGYYHDNETYFGALIGRYANRIANGRFTLNGITYNLNKNSDNNTLHGGFIGFNQKIWNPSISGQYLVLRYTSADGEERFPGKVDVTVTYELTDDNQLVIRYNATTTRPTVINLTNHAYYNLAGQGTGRVDDHVVKMYADNYTPVNSESIPTGEIRRVSGSVFDLTSPTRLGDRLSSVPGGKGYDHNFCMGKTGWLKYFVRVHHPASGRYIDMYSTEPGVQFYTAYYLNMAGKGGKRYKRFGAFCLEAQHYPDSPNQPSFPSTVLRPREVYQQTTKYHFGVL